MNISKIIVLSFVVLILAFGTTGISHAELIDNGDGTVTDTDMGLMWLQDANYAMTSGYSASGRLNFNDATIWANDLVFASYDDWRLPSPDLDCGIDYWCSNSEMGNLFYNEGIKTSAQSPFINIGAMIGADPYWSNDTYWFSFTDGAQDFAPAHVTLGAWAVRDVTVVPEPISSTLFLIGGATLGCRCFRKKFNE